MGDSLQNIKEEKLISIEDLKWIGGAIAKGWYLFFLMPIIVGAIGFFYSYRITPEYSAKIQILLKSNDVYDYQSSIQKSVGYAQSYTDIRTQQRILSSYDLIERTLSKLDLDVSTGLQLRFFPDYSSPSTRDGSKRRDINWDIYASMTYHLTPRLGLRGFYRYIQGNNRNNFYDYDRQKGGMQLMYSQSF